MDQMRQGPHRVVVDNPDLHALLAAMPPRVDDGIRWVLEGHDLGGSPAALRVHDLGNKVTVARPDICPPGHDGPPVHGATRPVALTVAALAAALLDDPQIAHATLDLDGCHVEAVRAPAAPVGA